MDKRHSRVVKAARILLVAGFLGAAGLPLQAVSASPPAQDPGLSPAEEYMLDELITNGYVDLAAGFPDEDRRIIRAGFLLSVLNRPEIQSKKSIYITNATIDGPVEASSNTLPYFLFLEAVIFNGYVLFSNSVFASVAITGSTFQQGVELQDITAENLFLSDNTFWRGINLYGARIGELILQDSRILGTEPMREGISFPAELRRMRISSLADLNGTYFEGVAAFAESEFHALEMWGAQFAEAADFSKVLVNRSGEFVAASFLKAADFEQAVFGNASFERVSFGGDANFQQASFGDAAFPQASFAGDANFQKASFRDAAFARASFAGKVTLNNATVRGDLNFDGATFSAADSPVDLSEIEVADTTSLTDFRSASGIDMKYSSFKDLKINVRDSGAIASLDLTQAEINGQFAITSSQINNVNVNGLQNGGTATLDHLTITESLDLQNANLNLLVVNELKWPESPESFNLRGMTFSDIDLGERGLTEETWRELLRLVNTSAYSPQAYKAISQFFMDKGYPDWAAEMELAGKRRERDEVLTRFSGPWLWSWFLDIFSGYGYRPLLAFIWSALVIVAGALVYRRKEDMIPVNQAEARVEYNPVWYSFALFLPYIDLGIQGKWEPDPQRKWARNYKYIHLLLGWILTPIALLAFGGVFR